MDLFFDFMAIASKLFMKNVSAAQGIAKWAKSEQHALPASFKTEDCFMLSTIQHNCYRDFPKWSSFL